MRIADSCLSNRIVGRKCSASFIDRAFLEWRQPKMEDQELVSKDFRTSSHFIMMKMGRILLERFERVKQRFQRDGTWRYYSSPRNCCARRSTGSHCERSTYPHRVRDEEFEWFILGNWLTSSRANLRNFFERSVMRTIRLISRRVT